jgi:hypothetical protein
MASHSLCDACYAKREPGREPYRIVNPDAPEGEREGAYVEVCCSCGQPTTAGIYYHSPGRVGFPYCSGDD